MTDADEVAMYLTKDKSGVTGFSLIELIVVIVLLGILAVSVSSRFSDSSGFSEFAYQQRLLASLRAMQTRAMHDTRSGYCFQINFSQSPLAFGPPALSYVSGNSADTCSTVIDYSNDGHLATTQTELNDNHISNLQALDGTAPISYLGFDHLGRPLTSVDNCTNDCQITLSGESSAAVCIESQGYIHACE